MYTIFWFRRDLRLEDNAGLYHALKSGKPVLPLFIFDRNILDQLRNPLDRRLEFIHQALKELQNQLGSMDIPFLFLYDSPLEAWKKINSQLKISSVYTNEDYEPYAIQRDQEVKIYLQSQGVEFKSFKDQVIFEKSEILTDGGKPYTVFSPYSRKWRKKLNDFYVKPYPTEKYFAGFAKKEVAEMQGLEFRLPELKEMGFQPAGLSFPSKSIREEIIKNYSQNRDLPGIEGTSRLSVHLRFGTLSIRKLASLALKLSDGWLNELCWRDFYMMILYHFPHVTKAAFKPIYDRIEWRNNAEEFEAWCAGKTGYPLVDAGMRELNATGFMHNRVRMVTASFLCKHLLIDWRWGEAYFAEKLLDFDLSANNGGWQWASGSGCDAAPYFRVFNPTLQAEKFDKQLLYIRKWIPEINEFSYPRPMVEHAFARDRALKTYKEGVGNTEIMGK